ncbi:MAG: DHH family phosphoesterase [Halobacteriaceae archaeon]
MQSRLVLGCGSVGRSLVHALADRGGDLRVLDGDAGRVEGLRETGIAADLADVTDPDAIAGREVDTVVVAGDDPAQNLAAARAAGTAYPGAALVVYPGAGADAGDRAAVAGLADRAIDPGAAVLDHVGDRATGDSLERVRGLRDAVTGVDGRLGVFAHDNPDPDAIGSAVALVHLARSLGVEAEACYYGEISHQENRAMVNLLELSLRQFAPGEAPDHAAVALVDHARAGVNDGLPPDADVRVVLDHHPKAGETAPGAFVDRRESVGATSTILAEYVRRFDVDVAGPVATGLLYGIRVDTDDFRREVSVADFEAAADLLPDADRDALSRIESPAMSHETLDTLASAVRERTVREGALVSVVGRARDRDALAQAADALLALETVDVAVVAGFDDGTVYVSGRARGTDVDLGERFRAAFADVGSAGGHADMAGAQLPLGPFEALAESSDAALAVAVRLVLTGRVFGALDREVPALPAPVAAAVEAGDAGDGGSEGTPETLPEPPAEPGDGTDPAADDPAG